MTNLVLTRKAGQSVRLMIDGKAVYFDMLHVTGGFCEVMVTGNPETQRIRFRNSLRISETVSVLVVDLAKGHVKLNFTAPKEVHILRTELIKEDAA